MAEPVGNDAEMGDAHGAATLPTHNYNVEFTWCKYSICGTLFDLPSYYEVLRPIGQGAYGVVW